MHDWMHGCNSTHCMVALPCKFFEHTPQGKSCGPNMALPLPRTGRRLLLIWGEWHYPFTTRSQDITGTGTCITSCDVDGVGHVPTTHLRRVTSAIRVACTHSGVQSDVVPAKTVLKILHCCIHVASSPCFLLAPLDSHATGLLHTFQCTTVNAALEGLLEASNVRCVCTHKPPHGASRWWLSMFTVESADGTLMAQHTSTMAAPCLACRACACMASLTPNLAA